MTIDDFLTLILLKMATLKPMEIKAEKECDCLKIIQKGDNGDSVASAPGEVEEIKVQRNSTSRAGQQPKQN